MPEGQCQECHKVEFLHGNGYLCEDCYEKMFVEDDDEFILKSDIAEIKAIDNSKYYNSAGLKFTMPDIYALDPSAEKDVLALVEFMLKNMCVYDNAKGFDKVKYMFKKVE